MGAAAAIGAAVYCLHGLLVHAMHGDRSDGLTPVCLSAMCGLCAYMAIKSIGA